MWVNPVLYRLFLSENESLENMYRYENAACGCKCKMQISPGVLLYALLKRRKKCEHKEQHPREFSCHHSRAAPGKDAVDQPREQEDNAISCMESDHLLHTRMPPDPCGAFQRRQHAGDQKQKR